MSHTKRLTGFAIATAAAGLFASACTSMMSEPKEAMADTVKCEGINSCKGHASCKSAKNDCAGKNACKGQGWVKASVKECNDKGGKIIS